jgi:putative SOS response-associated peptidase YedK
MCNDYDREIEVARVIRLMNEIEKTPPFEWQGGRIPNDVGPTPHIRIRDQGLIVQLNGDKLKGSMTTWAWQTPTGKPVFNFLSEHREFKETERCLILATGFYEYTEPKKPKVKLKDQYLFTMKGQEWFWIAGVVKLSAFAMLTTASGPDIKPYHDRQICVLPPATGLHWLNLDLPERDILGAPPPGAFEVRTLRRDGVNLRI